MGYVREGKGKWTNDVIPTKSTTAYVAGELLYNDGTNDIPATSSTEKIKGFVVEAKVSAATTTPIVIRVPKSVDASLIMDITGAGITAASVGKGYDLSDSVTVNAAASTICPVILTRYISATKGEFRLNYDTGITAN